jgi:hypothetical protein
MNYSKISLERKKGGQKERRPAHMSYGKKASDERQYL